MAELVPVMDRLHWAVLAISIIGLIWLIRYTIKRSNEDRDEDYGD